MEKAQSGVEDKKYVITQRQPCNSCWRAVAYGVHSHSSCLQVQRLPQVASANDVPQRAQVTERQCPRDCHIHVQQDWWTITLSVSRPRTGYLGCDTGLTDPLDNIKPKDSSCGTEVLLYTALPQYQCAYKKDTAILFHDFISSKNKGAET